MAQLINYEAIHLYEQCDAGGTELRWKAEHRTKLSENYLRSHIELLQ